MNFVFWILFAGVGAVSYWIGRKIKSYWALLSAPIFGVLAAGVNLWIYFSFAPLGETNLAGVLGLLVVTPVFMVIISALDTFAALVGAFFGVRRGKK